MFRVTYYPAGGKNGLKLCESSRSLAEHDVTINHRRVVAPLQFYGAIAASASDMGNRRNQFAFSVFRDSDFAGKSFPDEYASVLWAIDATNLVPGNGYLVIEMSGQKTSATRVLTDVVLPEFSPLAQWSGVGVISRYSFDGGLFTKAAEPTT